MTHMNPNLQFPDLDYCRQMGWVQFQTTPTAARLTKTESRARRRARFYAQGLTSLGTPRWRRLQALSRTEYTREYRARLYRAGKTARGTEPQKLNAFVFNHNPPPDRWPRPTSQ